LNLLTSLSKKLRVGLCGLWLACLTTSVGLSQDSSLLWEITGNGLEAPSYLFGTIHLICEGDFTPGEALTSSLRSTHHLLLELDMTDPSLTASLMSNMFMKEGRKLSDLITSEEYSRINLFFRDSIGFDIDRMAAAKPFLLSSLIVTKTLSCPIESVEGRLVELAQSEGSRISGLETPQEQAALFDHIPYQAQAQLVVNLIDSLSAAIERFVQTQDVYKQQDIERIYTFTTENDFDFAGFDEVILANRNKKWLPKIEDAARALPTFVAVGAAHLGGSDGLVKLLQKRGYTLKPIRVTL
jgi:uncharacterized protein YbaP (TraB family)